MVMSTGGRVRGWIAPLHLTALKDRRCLLQALVSRTPHPPLMPRSRDGSVVSYPLTETVHKDNICHVTETPADVPASVAASARAVAERAIACLGGAGIFGCVGEGRKGLASLCEGIIHTWGRGGHTSFGASSGGSECMCTAPLYV